MAPASASLTSADLGENGIGEAGEELGQLLECRVRVRDQRVRLLTAHRYVDAAIEAVAVAGCEHLRGVVSQPGEPIEIALIASRGARRLGATRVVGRHIAEPVELAEDGLQPRCGGRKASRARADVRNAIAG